VIDRFAWPWFFVLLAVLPVLVALWSRPKRRPAALYSATSRAGAVGSGWRARLVWVPGAVRLLALTLLIGALARPQAINAEKQTKTEGIAIQLVVDRSRSMDEPGTLDGQRMTRLDAAKKVVADFITGGEDGLNGREGDLIGLIVFGTYADTLCPLVREHTALLEILKGVEIPLLQSEGGTAIGDALALAAARLRSAEDEIARARKARDETFEIKSKAIVLLTDGENTAGQLRPLEAAQLAKDWGIRVYIIGIRGGASQVIGGLRVNIGQQVNERELGRVAELTGGRFWGVDNLASLPEVYREIDELEKTEISVDEHTEYEERFMPLAIAAFALIGVELLLRTTVLRRLP